MDRQHRKIQHIEQALALPEETGTSGFQDLLLVHNALPEMDPGDIDLSCTFLGKKLAAPLLINAITGGHEKTLPINRALARLAARCGLAIAVGSQKAALEDPAVIDTFRVVREENPTGVVLANLSATCQPGEARRAVEMLAADGLQLHLNAAQELAMVEGETNFGHVADNIARVAGELSVPVIVKEVGFGLSRDVVRRLYAGGITHFDIAGRGGTNFLQIELARRGAAWPEISDWGIPTAAALLECVNLQLPVTIIASGGVRTYLDIVKALVAGAQLVGMARPLLQAVYSSEDVLFHYVDDLLQGMRRVMFLLGAVSIDRLARVPLVITGATAQWLAARGVDIAQWGKKDILAEKEKVDPCRK
ncbi:type 2 isopentenyl-diphosphate Delta-isomerase [Desulfurispora thermophila]|uniref:type 2 isopentenyl-diphosphate Delta-isomerase n=1 Tax=Desulfurispora thermophila TaxID=265470 RepID=UPI00036045B6|nr:type 2 isopentenyl-diphosphate Delta-isomerase [Desulfurispora thermophila]